MSETVQKRKELLEKIVPLAESSKYNLNAMIFILSHDDYDKVFPPELLTSIEAMVDNLAKVNAVVMDAVQVLLFKV